MNHSTRRRLRLPQLNKANRLARRNRGASEFVVQCDAIEWEARVRRDRAERLRLEIEDKRAREAALASVA